MLFHLHPRQTVVVVDKRNIYFRHRTTKGVYRGVTLEWRHLQNLHDVVSDLETFKNMKFYPLGDGIWLNNNHSCVELVDNRASAYFSFYTRSWYAYIKHVHERLYSFFRHDARRRRRQLPSDQHDENVKSQSNSQSGRRPSFLSQRNKTLPRSAGNAHYANEQRKECAVVSSRTDTDSRQCKRIESRKNAGRAPSPPSEDREDGEVSSNETTSEEYGCDFSLEEGYMSTED